MFVCLFVRFFILPHVFLSPCFGVLCCVDLHLTATLTGHRVFEHCSQRAKSINDQCNLVLPHLLDSRCSAREFTWGNSQWPKWGNRGQLINTGDLLDFLYSRQWISKQFRNDATGSANISHHGECLSDHFSRFGARLTFFLPQYSLAHHSIIP